MVYKEQIIGAQHLLWITYDIRKKMHVIGYE